MTMIRLSVSESQEPSCTSDLSLPARRSARSASAASLWCGQTLLVLLAAFLLLTSGNAYAQNSVEADRAALVALYNATDGPNWAAKINWLSNERLSEWYGVTTDANGRVTKLNLYTNQLTGSIPTELGQLTQLKVLNLYSNQLTGPIPTELGQLTQLQLLNLYWNQLTGPIPTELGQLTQLQVLNLTENQLTGPIPTELGQLTQLRSLSLHDNELTGKIPVELGDLAQLQHLYLGENELTGEIPVELGDLAQLQRLYLGENELTGEIPVELGQLTQLSSLNLGENELTGEIPVELGDLTQLVALLIHDNKLTGEIPVELAQLTQLQLLYLYTNELTGEIPVELGDLTQLVALLILGNELTGKIPVELGQLTQLWSLNLGENELTGEIPVELGDLTQLVALLIHDNKLTGEIPVELAQLTQLQWLYLGENELTGEIPVELGDLAQLQRLYLHSNRLTGPIPSWLVNLAKLRELSLWSNELTGLIPAQVAPAQDRAALRVFYVATGGANWTDNTDWLSSSAPLSEWYGVTTDENGRVTSLSLSANGLTGTIGAELGVLTRLTGLHLNDNQLTGTIPPELENLAQLQMFDIRNTGLCVTADSELHTWIATIQDFQGTATCQQSFSIPDRGGWSTTSSGTAETLRVGYGRIRADAGSTTPSGIAIFQFRDSQGVLISEAGVPASEPVQEGRIFAEVNGPVNTGLAIANPNDVQALIQFYFTDTNGTRFAEGSFELGAHQQTAKFLDQAPFNSGSFVLGTLTFTSSVPVGVIALRGLTNEAGEFLMTTLPVAPLSSTSSDTVYFPHFADGNGWATQVILVNPTDRTIAGTVAFLGQGSVTAAAAPVVLTLDGGSTRSNFDYSIPPRSAQRFTTANPPGGLAVGSVRATPDRGNTAPAGLVVFSFAPGEKTLSEAGVSALPKGSAFRVYVEASGVPGQVGSIRSGLAITNAGATTNTVTLEVTSLDGSLAGPPATLALPPLGHSARFIDEMFTLPDNFSGVVRVTSTDEVAIVGLRLRVNERGELKMTTTPPSNQTGPSPLAETFFPHIVDSGGWSTQFILFSGTAGQASSGTLRFIDASGQPLDLPITQP